MHQPSRRALHMVFLFVLLASLLPAQTGATNARRASSLAERLRSTVAPTAPVNSTWAPELHAVTELAVQGPTLPDLTSTAVLTESVEGTVWQGPRAGASSVYQLMLPLLAGGSDTRSAPSATPDGGQVRSTDGYVTLTVPAGAVSENVWITLAMDAPRPPVDASRSLDVFFRLTAQTASGQAVTQFNKPLTLDVHYTPQASQPRLKAGVYFFNLTHSVWEKLPTTEPAAGRLRATTNHFTDFGVLLEPPLPATCSFTVGQGSPNVGAFEAAYTNAGGYGELFCPTGPASNGSGTWTQLFDLGSAIIYNADQGLAHHVTPEYLSGYTAAGGFATLGAPIESTRTAVDRGNAPANYYDDTYDFRTKPIQLFRHGFVGYDTGGVTWWLPWRGAYHFPLVCRVSAFTLETIVPPDDPDDPDAQATRLTTLTVRAGGFAAPAAPLSAATFTAGRAYIRVDELNLITRPMSVDGDGLILTYTDERPEPEAPPSFSFWVEANRSGDGFTGYAPADIRDGGDDLPVPVSTACPDGSGWSGGYIPPADTIRPTVNEPLLLQDGFGGLIVLSVITDNVSVADATAFIDDRPYPMSPLGGDLYGVYVQPPLRVGTHQLYLTAHDPTGNEGRWPRSGTKPFKITYTGVFGVVPWVGYSKDPVNTLIGNFIYEYTDVALAEPGPDLTIHRFYNSQSTTVGRFGLGWSTLLDMRVIPFDGKLLAGAMVRYADGRTALFPASGTGFGRAPYSFDTLVRDGSGYLLTTTDQTRYRFDEDGRLVRVEDLSGNALTLTYNGDVLSAITSSSGRVLTFTSDAEGRITGLTGPEDTSLAYAYDDDGRLLSVTDSNDEVVTYEYDPDHGLTRLTTPSGHDFVPEQRYDEQGRLVYQRVGENFINRFVYDDANRTVAVSDTYGRTMIHRYDEQGRLIEQIDALGKSDIFTYNSDNQITSHTDRNGNTTQYEYLDGNKVKEIDVLGGVRTWTYDSGRRVTSETDQLGRTTSYEYDAKGRQTAIVDALGQRTQMVYNDAGQVVERRGPRGDVTRYEYDTAGNLTAETDALGNTTRYAYDGQGRKIKQINALGGVRTWAYDANGNVLSETDELGHIVAYAYGPNNERLSETDANGNTTRYTYSKLGKLLITNYADGGVKTISYDDMGNRVGETNPVGSTRLSELDPLYRVVKSIDSLGGVTAYTYDAVGNPTTITDPRGFTTRVEYDALNREVRRIDPLGGVTETTYDAVGNRTEVKVPNGAVTTYSYDSLNRVVQVTDALGGVTKTSYDAAGNRVVETDALGEVTKREYDLLNREIKTTDALGNATRIEYDALNRVVEVTDANGATTRTTYDAAGRAIQVTDALGNVSLTEYDPMGNTTVVTDALGFATTTAYDVMNRSVAVTDALSNVRRTSYDLAGRRVAVTDENGNTTTYRYDAEGRVVLVTDQLGFTVTSVYDLAGNPVETVDQEGSTTRFEYDALNRRMRQVNGLGFATSFSYDVVGNLLRTTDAKGAVTSTSYDLLNRPTAQTNALGYTTKHTYDALGRRISSTDANGVVTTRTYDALGHITSETDGEGFSRTFVYDAVGNQVSATDARGNTSTTSFDLLQRPVEQRDSIGLVRRLAYDAVGNVVAMTDGNSNTTRRTYDALRRKVTEVDAEGNTSTIAYDAVGNITAETDGNGNTTRHVYDERNQRVSTTDARGNTTRFTYDKVGRLLMATDAAGVITLNGYDAVGQLVAVTLNYNASSLPNAQTNVKTNYVYDAVGNRISSTDPKGAITTFTPDALGQLVAETDPLGNTTVYVFDAVGNQVERREPNGNVVRTTFDRNRRPVLISYDDGSTVAKKYDGNGNLIEVRDSSGVTSFTYDARNRKTTETSQYGTSQFTYDGANNELSVTYPDGRTLRKSYYRNNWLQTTTTPAGSVARYSYDAVGQMVRLEGGDGTLTSQSYDAANNLLLVEKRKVGPNGKLLIGISYTYDAINQRTQVTYDYRDGQPRRVTETYTQDRLRRLTEMRDSAGVVVRYTYDAANNRTSWAGNDDPRTNKPFDAFSLAYAYDAADQLTRVDDSHAGAVVTYGYDANGNRVEQQSDREAVIYVYDNENRVASVQEFQITGSGKWNAHEVTTMTYDGLGRRVAKTVDDQAGGGGAKTRTYAYADLDPLGYTETWNGQHVNLYRAAGGHILAQDRYSGGDNGQQLWLTQDGLGSTVALAQDNGQTAKNYRYDPYGVADEREFDSATHIDFLFTGQEHDASTELYHFYARDYDPETGTWLTRDPYRGTPNDPQSLHRYGYVKGNPVNLRDAYGYFAWCGTFGKCETENKPPKQYCCGATVTEWLVNQMNTNRDHPAIKTMRENKWVVYVPGFGAGFVGAALMDFKSLVETGGPWDFKSWKEFGVATSGSRSCPSKECKRTVTICDMCFDYDVPGNIHYGWVGAQAGYRTWLLHAGASGAQAGGVDDPADSVAIDIGIEMAEKGTPLCSLLQQKRDALRKGPDNCKACNLEYTGSR
jgi:RHS repeat-associated protein